MDPWSRIEIENKAVGTLDVIYGRRPWMQFNGIHIDEAEQALEIVNPDPDALATFPLLYAQLMHCVWNRQQRAAMIERDPVPVPHELQPVWRGI